MSFARLRTYLSPIAVGLVLFAGVSASVELGRLDIERRAANERSRVTAALGTVRARLHGIIQSSFSSTDGLIHLIQLSGGIDQTLFDGMARLAIGKNPHIRNITLAPNDRIAMVYPLGGNERALGFRYATNPEQYRTVRRARDERHAILAGPVDLVQGGRGLINRSPIFIDRRDGAHYWGTVSVVAFVDSIFEDSGVSAATDVSIAIRGKDGLGADGEMVTGDAALFQQAPVTMTMPIPGGEWLLAARPARGWSSRSVLGSTYFYLGILNTLVVSGVLGMVALQSRRMRLKNQALEREVLERKRAESALRAEEERLRLASTIITTTAEGVLITNEKAQIISVNRAFTEITGYAEAEVLGQSPNVLRSERQDPDFYQRMWASLAQGDVWQGEIWNRRKSGDIFPEWLTITAIRDQQGRVCNYVGVFSDISSLKRSQEQLERLAHFDPLTDLPNRFLFQDRLAHAVERAHRHPHQLAILLMDLDGFKTVNDSLGHPVGDRLLQEVAERLKASVRVDDTVARLGGDEFALILPELSDGSDAVEVIRKILTNIQEPFNLDGVSAMVTGSIGVSIYPTDGSNATELIRNADAAMYGAKEAGRNAYRFYQSSMTDRAHERLRRERALRRGLDNHEFEVWFQPQIDLSTRKVTGAEALVRWRDPERGLVPPAEFIPLAERTGLIVPLGEQVLRQVCQYARDWELRGLPFGKLAVNVAPTQLERSDFVATLRDCLQATGARADRLEIEITESLIMENAGHAREVLLAIQNLKVSTSIDDFGTGYSSLAYLKQLPIDNLKIDRTFIKDLPDDANDIAITRTIIAMAHSLGFKVIAEGVETKAQRDFLSHEGCDEAQGYLISRPMPASDFELWLVGYQP